MKKQKIEEKTLESNSKETFSSFEDYERTFFPKAVERRLLEGKDSYMVGKNIVRIASEKMKAAFSNKK